MFCASRALFSMKARRGSTSSPIRVTNTSSGGDGVFDADFQEAADGRIHRGFPKLFRIHLAQAFVSLDGHAFLGNAHQDVQSAFKAVDVVFVVAFVELRPFADHAFECGGGLG